MKINIEINNIQHVSMLKFDIDLSLNKLTCLVGKNGIGKTTLVKAIQNLRFADTFTQTSQPGIFREDSAIKYQVDTAPYVFSYDPDIRSLNSKDIIPDAVKGNIDVELPMPYGQRFSFFQTLAKADPDIRSNIVMEAYESPVELIEFLSYIYSTDKFKNLVKVKVRRDEYYCILLEDSRYIREDYLSSGEYLLISVYRKIKGGCRLIVIDEIDMSLDAAAQTRLAKRLREFCALYNVNILFTTHSLALMKTLEDHEIFYLLDEVAGVHPIPASYSYVKSVLFGFKGWDRYILTEDDVLQNLIGYVLKKYHPVAHFQYKIIYIGGGSGVVDLMARNAKEEFFAGKENVISILDGDQAGQKHVKNFSNVHCIPFPSVEKQLHADYYGGSAYLSGKLGQVQQLDNKAFYKHVTRSKLMSEAEIIEYICDTHAAETQAFAKIFDTFLYPTI
ncbi:AAA family ATPase [Pseudomonas monteilii]|uniref:AAA family ATPase n=1 Tax=Pseudomonas monteilii TaxID=76759 RepID=UPI0013784763|nr:AAA family ATPase [Pseudomonas monteilii]NBB06719.1 AAA family ATPase [Pseudomonas monteilii]